EEIERRLPGIPDVEVVRASRGFVQCEELVAKARHAFEREPSVVGDADHSSAVERTLVLEADVYTNHGSSFVPSAAARDGRGDLVVLRAARCDAVPALRLIWRRRIPSPPLAEPHRSTVLDNADETSFRVRATVGSE